MNDSEAAIIRAKLRETEAILEAARDTAYTDDGMIVRFTKPKDIFKNE